MGAVLDVDRLAEVCQANQIPGAVLGVRYQGRTESVAHGVVNLRTGVATTTDTVFQVGSITKVWTATLVMMLVDEGLLDLDVPVRTYLPAFRVLDEQVSAAVTLRHLLSHTSGIAGDHFHDTGRGDDNLERYVASCAELGQEHELGATMSYCNSGYSIIGRVIEVVTGQSWDKVLRRRLMKPLSLRSAGTLPEQALLHRAAVGHLTPPGQSPQVTPVWHLPRSAGPAGCIHATADDLFAFVRLHLAGGVGPDGARLVSSAGIAAMQEPQVEVPDRWTLATHWGLGWMLFRASAPGFGHDGSTVGQYAFLRVLPDSETAVCLLTNGGTARTAWDTLFAELVRELDGVEVEPKPTPPAIGPRLDLAVYEGRYERLNVSAEVQRNADGLQLRIEKHGLLALASPPESRVEVFALTPVDEALFLAQLPGAPSASPLVFFDFDEAYPRRFHHGGRAITRTSDRPV